MTHPVTFVTTAVRAKQAERDELQRAMDDFLARGGTIQQLQPGEGSQVTLAPAGIPKPRPKKKKAAAKKSARKEEEE